MLQLSGLGTVSQDFMDCMAEGGDRDVCTLLHPPIPDAPGLTSEEEASIEIDSPPEADPWTVEQTLSPLVPGSSAGVPAGSHPPITSPDKKPSKLPIKTIAIAATLGLGLLGAVLYVRSSSKTTVVP
jgi:hypothetical protein